jgi:phosphate transport system substrate-binding protein
LTFKQIYNIYLGRVTNWKDLGGPDEPIDLYGVAAQHDGVEYSMRRLIYNKGDQGVAVPRLYLNTAKLEEGVTIDPRSLGFTTESAVYGNKGIKMLTVEGHSASSSTIADGSYPLFCALYLATRKDGKNAEAVDRFIQYATSESGKAVLRRHQLIPYDDAPGLMKKFDEQIAFIDASVHAPTPTPVSAPQATADYLVRTQPNSVEAQQAKERAARAAADKAAKEKAGSQ